MLYGCMVDGEVELTTCPQLDEMREFLRARCALGSIDGWFQRYGNDFFWNNVQAWYDMHKSYWPNIKFSVKVPKDEAASN